jgi:hypothetical protein
VTPAPAVPASAAAPTPPAVPEAPGPDPTRPRPRAEPTADDVSDRQTKGKGARGGRSRWRGRAKSDQPVEQAPHPEPATRPAPAVAAAPPATRLVGRPEVPVQDRTRPNPNEGLTPDQQIARRNQASRADASILAAKRAQAASRALGLLKPEIAANRTAPVIERPAPAAPAPAPTLAPAPAPAPELRAPETPTMPAPAAAPPKVPVPSRPSRPEPTVTTAAPAAHAGATSPLLEVATSPLGADLEHLGDRLAIFVDRVELRDRLDRVRRSIPGGDIVDVSVEKRPHSATLTVESAAGPGIAAKGLRPDQADEARRLILDKTRPPRLAERNGDTTPATTRPAPAPPAVDAAGLRAKLADLHHAGVLTDDEYRQKLLLVGRLAGGEPLSRSPR